VPDRKPDQKYERIAATIREQIQDGRYQPGARLPSLADLEAEHDVSHSTSRKVFELLVAEGLVKARKGYGYTVAVAVISRDGERWYRFGTGSPFFAEERAAGRRPGLTRETSRVVADATAADLLGIEGGAALTQTDYVFTSDDRRVMTSRSWEPLALTGGTPIEDPESGVSKDKGVLDRFALIGIRGTHVIEKPQARQATAAEAQVFGVGAGSPVLEITRIHWAGDLRFEAAIIVAGPSYRPSYRLPTADA
jgi:GntR family transcriptional regulator